MSTTTPTRRARARARAAKILRGLGRGLRAIGRPWRLYALWAYAFGGLALIGYGAGEIYAPLRTLLPGALIWLDISTRAARAAKPKPKTPRRKAPTS